jgi:multimeric flavodoxin WrbA
VKKIVIINGSPRASGNSDAMTRLAESRLGGAASTEVFYMRQNAVIPCVGCDSCKETDECVHDDSAAALIGRLKRADGALLFTPLYYTSVPGVVKVLFDRFYVEYNPWRYGLKTPSPNRRFGVVFTYGGSPADVVERAVELSAYAFADLGFGSHKSVMCAMNIEKDSFEKNGEYRREVERLLDWMLL